jgi:hypothetical protein
MADLIMEKCGGFGDNLRTVRVARLLPGSEAGSSDVDLLLELRVSYCFERLKKLIVEWIDARVGRGFIPFGWLRTDYPVRGTDVRLQPVIKGFCPVVIEQRQDTKPRTEPVTYADGVVAEGSEFTQMTSRE